MMPIRRLSSGLCSRCEQRFTVEGFDVHMSGAECLPRQVRLLPDLDELDPGWIPQSAVRWPAQVGPEDQDDLALIGVAVAALVLWLAS